MPKVQKLVNSLFFGIILLSISVCFCFANSYPDNNQFKTEILKESIKSVFMHREGWRLGYPIIELNAEVSLVLRFDDLSEGIKNYQYKIIHCNSDWTQSNLTDTEYLDGSIFQNEIKDYQFSFNTYTSYQHYFLKLPNEDVSFKVSGNYIIQVYEDYDE